LSIFLQYTTKEVERTPPFTSACSPLPRKAAGTPSPIGRKILKEKKQTTTYIWFIIVIYPPLYRKSSPNRLLFL